MKPFHRVIFAAFVPIFLACAAGSFQTSPVLADEGHEGHEHVVVSPEKLGTVHFQITASAEEQKAFDRAVAFLHSFEYEEAETAFSRIADKNSQNAMALWGMAMCNYHPIWGPTTQADFERGRASIIQPRADEPNAVASRREDDLAILRRADTAA